MFLASDLSGYETGHTVISDGGVVHTTARRRRWAWTWNPRRSAHCWPHAPRRHDKMSHEASTGWDRHTSIPEVIDAHTHVMRSRDHGREAFAYFLSRNPRSGHPAEPVAYGTVDELRGIMRKSGVSLANILMFTWSGQYWRDGQYTLPDGAARPAAAE